MDSLSLPFLSYSKLFAAVEEQLQETLDYDKFKFEQSVEKSAKWKRAFSVSRSSSGGTTTSGQALALFGDESTRRLLQATVDNLGTISITKLQLQQISNRLWASSTLTCNSMKQAIGTAFTLAIKPKKYRNIWELNWSSGAQLCKIAMLRQWHPKIYAGSQVSFSLQKPTGMLNFTLLGYPFGPRGDCLIGLKMNPILGHFDMYQLVQVGRHVTVGGYCFLNCFNLESECTLGMRLRKQENGPALRMTVNSTGFYSIAVEQMPVVKLDDSELSLACGIMWKPGQKPQFGLQLSC